MLKELARNIPVLVISAIATVTGGTAVTKLVQDIAPVLQANNREVREISVSPTPTVSPNVGDNEVLGDTTAFAPTDPASVMTAPIVVSQSNTQTSTANTVKKDPVVAAASVFTLASLATHNTGSSCYVAYKGVVYDVTNHPSWQGCGHHGAKGGRDITAIFPHPTTYLTTLPKVGTLQGGSPATGGTGSTASSSDDDQDEDDDNREREDGNDNDDRESGDTREDDDD